MTDETTCAVCLESLDDNIYTIPECNHKFHNNCIIEWYRRLGSDSGCPMCRSHPEGTSFYTKRGVVSLCKKISRRKNCPEIIKKLCTQHTNCNKEHVIYLRKANEFRKQHKEIFDEHSKLRRKIYTTSNKRWKIEKELISLPQLILLRYLSI